MTRFRVLWFTGSLVLGFFGAVDEGLMTEEERPEKRIPDTKTKRYRGRKKSVSININVGSVGPLAKVSGLVVQKRTIARQPAPRLQLQVLEPTDAGFSIPHPRDRKSDVVAALDREAAHIGLPTRDWVRQVRAKRASEDDIQTYAGAVGEWYRLQALELHFQHKYETLRARTVFLVVAVINGGQAPAENVAIELSFPDGLSIKNSPSQRGAGAFRPPVRPSVLADQFDMPGPLSRGVTWYRRPPERRDRVDGEELFRRERKSKGQCYGARRNGNLEHGKSWDIRPLSLCFEYAPATNISVHYNLHASNQPRDSHGQFTIAVSDLD